MQEVLQINSKDKLFIEKLELPRSVHMEPDLGPRNGTWTQI